MHGNVWEWCEDVYAPYPTSGSEEPYEASGPIRVNRGGGWNDSAVDCRSANRNFNLFPGFKYYDIGFRVVLAPVLVQ